MKIYKKDDAPKTKACRSSVHESPDTSDAIDAAWRDGVKFAVECLLGARLRDDGVRGCFHSVPDSLTASNDELQAISSTIAAVAHMQPKSLLRHLTMAHFQTLNSGEAMMKNKIEKAAVNWLEDVYDGVFEMTLTDAVAYIVIGAGIIITCTAPFLVLLAMHQLSG